MEIKNMDTQEVATSADVALDTSAAPVVDTSADVAEIDAAVDHPAVSFLDQIEAELSEVGEEIKSAVMALVAEVKAVL